MKEVVMAAFIFMGADRALFSIAKCVAYSLIN